MLTYEEAIDRWARTKVKTKPEDTIKVDFDFDEGFACCGGADPGCYCSYAESPSFDVVIYVNGVPIWRTSLQYDMQTFLEELIVQS